MPYWRLSGFYFFYFATLGALVPYWSVYLRSIGFGAREIGELMALLMLSRIIAPYIWGWIADHKGEPIRVVRVAALMAIVSFAGVFFVQQFLWLALVMLAFSFFWNASLPPVEAATMHHFEGKGSRYARVRLWGSVGFIITVAGLGPVFDRVDAWWLLPVLMLLLIGIWYSSLVIPERELSAKVTHPQPFLKVLMRPGVFAFLATCFLMQASHGPYYTFYTLYLSDYGYSKTLVGMLWALGVICEIGVFMLLVKMHAYIGLRQILMVSCALAALRWGLIGFFPERLELIVLAQILHGATFGSFHATAIEMVHRFFRGRHQIRGQAIYGSVSFGLGGAIGSFYAGHVWTTYSPQTSFFVAAVFALFAWAVAWQWLRRANGDGVGGADQTE